MKIFHFISPKELDHIESEFRIKTGKLLRGQDEIETLLSAFPEVKAGAEEFFHFLLTDYEKRIEYEEKHPTRLYASRTAPVPEEVVEYRNSHKEVLIVCLERIVGQIMFDEYRWNSPEVQEAHTKSMVAGADYYKQFESNPDLAIDVLDNLKDRTQYSTETKKIAEGVIHGKYENC